MPWPGEKKEKMALPVPRIWCLPAGAVDMTECFLAGAGAMEKWIVLRAIEPQRGLNFC